MSDVETETAGIQTKTKRCESCDDVRGNPKRIVAYAMAVLKGSEKTVVETRLLEYSIISLVIIALLGLGAYLAIPSFGKTLMPFIPLEIILSLSTIMIVFSAFHMDSYRKNLSCTNGMMVGMTIGMMSGFLIGALLGATNGMFIGSVVGVLVGAVLGFAIGRYCGIMGALEGLMAGLMAGTMGAMLSVMMVNDHLILFMGFLFGICALITGGLSYMMHKEAGATTLKDLRVNLTGFVIVSIAIVVIVSIIMIYGPKTGLVYS